MVLDIVLAALLVVFMALGFRRGFMGTIVGFVAGLFAFVFSMFVARPIANFMDTLFGLSDALDGVLIDGRGRFMNLLICGAIVFIAIRLFFWWLSRLIRKLKEESFAVDVADKIAGMILGIARFGLGVSIFFVILHLMTAVPLVNNLVDSILSGSAFGQFLFDLVQRFLLPILGDFFASSGS